MAKSNARKKISKKKKSKDLNFINQMKISKQIKEELLRCIKSKIKCGLNRSMNRKKVLKKK